MPFPAVSRRQVFCVLIDEFVHRAPPCRRARSSSTRPSRGGLKRLRDSRLSLFTLVSFEDH